MELRPEYAKERMQICRFCDSFQPFTKTCSVCHCFMPGKTLIKYAACPLGKWQKIDDEQTP